MSPHAPPDERRCCGMCGAVVYLPSSFDALQGRYDSLAASHAELERALRDIVEFFDGAGVDFEYGQQLRARLRVARSALAKEPRT